MKNKILIFSLGIVFGAIGGSIREHKRMDNILIDKIKKLDASQRYRSLLMEWVNLYKRNITFDEYFKQFGMNIIAVYGNGKIGQRFINDMEHLQTQVDYIIDRKAAEMSSKLPIITLSENLPKVDGIVVTVLDDYDDIVEEISRKCNYSVISIEDVIYGSSGV